MRNAGSHQGGNEGQWKRANRNTYGISSIKHVTRKFHIAVVPQKCFFFFLLFRPIDFFAIDSLLLPFSITQF